MSKEKKSIIIIGGGISGLSTGCYAQMNNYESKIFELHFIPGGCCTAWKRKEFIFDQCIDWLLGTKPGNDMNQIWSELGALKDKKIRYFRDIFNRVVDTDGQTVNFYIDPNKLEKHLLEISPEDESLIKEFCDGMSAFMGVNFPMLKPIPLVNQEDEQKIKNEFLRPFGEILQKSTSIEIKDFAKRFKHPLLRNAFEYILQQQMPDFPLLPNMCNLTAMYEKNAGYPEGGSLELAKSIEKRYLELGGKMMYEQRVKKILVENDKAIGIMSEDGTKHFADIIISAADGRTTIFDMLDGKYISDDIKQLYEGLENKKYKTYKGFVLVFLGINRDLSDEPDSTTYFLEDTSPLTGSGNQRGFTARHYCHHAPEFAPEGKSVMQFFYYSDYDCWKELYDTDRDAYNKEKEKVGKYIIEFMDKKYPGLKEQVEYVDVSTPVTAVRYTANYKGSVMAWIPFADTEENVIPLVEKHHMKLPGLSNFYMAGHWVSLGGLVRSSASGRHVIQFLCRDENKEFRAFEGINKQEMALNK
ncbi:NAD(P)/FAD-dependent oxidoreductase [Clostridiaceae bacterium M8S5]|nr:NAD(P)/FAD-dependent oxidoreductase [Clostridiaceae bacterium M8S5]